MLRRLNNLDETQTHWLDGVHSELQVRSPAFLALKLGFNKTESITPDPFVLLFLQLVSECSSTQRDDSAGRVGISTGHCAVR